MQEKNLIVIQARFNSTRLPGKAMLPIADLPMISYLIRRLKVLHNSCNLVLSTGDNHNNHVIEKCAIDAGIPVCRGPEDDVLSRYIMCLESFPAQLVARVTGDNPLTDPSLIDNLLEAHSSVSYDYAQSFKGFPKGMGVDIFTCETLLILSQKANTPYEREHINEYILKNRTKFKIYKAKPSLLLNNEEEISCTVDTQNEFQQVKKLIESFPKHHFIGVEDVINKHREWNLPRRA